MTISRDRVVKGNRSVSAEETALRICRALYPLKKLYDEHFDSGSSSLVVEDPEVVSFAITELTEALFDLCGAPDDGPNFRRDHLWDLVDRSLELGSSDSSFTALVERVKEALP